MLTHRVGHGEREKKNIFVGNNMKWKTSVLFKLLYTNIVTT